MKKVLSILFCAMILLTMPVPASAAHVSAAEAIDTLETLGLVRGTGKGFEPLRTATRAESVVMLLRLLGREEAAEEADKTSPFEDGGWADVYLGYAYEEGLVSGISADRFGSANPVGARDYVTMMLRVLGYRDGEDFTWQGSLIFSDGLGLTHGEYAGDSQFLREDMALVSYTALTLKPKGADHTLIETLYLDGTVTAEALTATRLAGAVNVNKPVYAPSEIYERCSSAVVLTELFYTEESLADNKADATGSGFLISGDGLAVMSYHQLEGGLHARATTTDQRVYDLESVLYYDPQRDVAVVRLSTTDTEGNQLRFFPYLEVGDSDAIGNGEVVYSVSSPLGLMDSITDGLISNRSREVDDPDYLCIQVSVPISTGSSGGPLLNSHGEAIGIIFATYTRGQNLNLAVPINCIRNADLTAEGLPLSEVLRIENEKKAQATITVETDSVKLRVGETKEVVCSTDCPGQAGLRYDLSDSSAASCAWGGYVTRQSVPLRITGEAAGEADVTVSFSDGYGNEEAAAVIHVVVEGEAAIK